LRTERPNVAENDVALPPEKWTLAAGLPAVCACLQRCGDGLELDEGGGEVLNNLASDDLRRREVVRVLERLVAQQPMARM
jgi:hypothetical protein